MENATEALKMAFAVLVFVIAISLAITMFSRLNAVSKALIAESDVTTYYQYNTIPSTEKFRTVGIENVIPTLYKYYTENYTVLFLDNTGTSLKPFTLYTSARSIDTWGNIGETQRRTIYTIGGIDYIYDKDNRTNCTRDIFAFDVDEENYRHEPWSGDSNDYKENLDCILYGGLGYEYSDGSEQHYEYADKIRGGLVNYLLDPRNNIIIKEMLGEYNYSRSITNSNLAGDPDTNDRTVQNNKRVIIYVLEKGS